MKGEGYALYVGNDCFSCNKIEQFIKENNVNVSTINIDEEEYNLPFSLMIIPALVKNKKLIAYGPDIIKHIEEFKAVN